MTNTIEFRKLGFQIDLNPIAFSIGDFHVYWYGIIIALGTVSYTHLGCLGGHRVSLQAGSGGG